MISFRDLTAGLRTLELDPRWPLLVHASLSALGEVRGGAETVLGAILAGNPAVMMPTFTYRTMLVPETGPQGNGMRYGAHRDQNSQAEFFRKDMPADASMGVIAEKLRQTPTARRSMHPILSFSGVNTASALQTQTLQEPLAPLSALAREGGWVLLVGVNHTTNTSLHVAEKLAGRKQFIRWALTYEGVVECPGWPGCSNGFDSIGPHLEPLTRAVQIGGALVRAIPMQAMINLAADLIRQNPQALLCDDLECARCGAVRAQNLRADLAEERDHVR